eukprot:754-Heterococcus_DN1.PRE.2
MDGSKRRLKSQRGTPCHGCTLSLTADTRLRLAEAGRELFKSSPALNGHGGRFKAELFDVAHLTPALQLLIGSAARADKARFALDSDEGAAEMTVWQSAWGFFER